MWNVSALAFELVLFVCLPLSLFADLQPAFRKLQQRLLSPSKIQTTLLTSLKAFRFKNIPPMIFSVRDFLIHHLFVLLDLICLYLYLSVVALEFDAYCNTNDMAWETGWGSLKPITAFLSGTENQVYLTAIIGLFLWFKMVTTKLQAFSKVTVLIAAISQMIGELFSFFGILLMVFTAFGTTKYLLTALKGVSSQDTEGGLLKSVFAEFLASVNMDDDSKDNEIEDDEATLLHHFLGPAFAVLVPLILMNVLITMLMDLYSNEKEAAEAHWCKKQVFMVLEEEARKAKLEALEADRRRKIEEAETQAVEAAAAALNADAGAKEPPGGTPLQRNSISGQRRGADLWGIARSRFLMQNRVVRTMKQIITLETIHDLAVSLKNGESDTHLKEKFTEHVNTIVPELQYFVGDVRTPDGIEQGIEKISNKTLCTLNALRRIVSPTKLIPIRDVFLRSPGKTGFEPSHKCSPLPHSDERVDKLKRYAMDVVGLSDISVLEGFIACLTFEQLGKIMLWREQLQEVIGDCHSVSDFRVLCIALDAESCHSRFLPSFRNLPVRLSVCVSHMALLLFHALFHLVAFAGHIQDSCEEGFRSGLHLWTIRAA